MSESSRMIRAAHYEGRQSIVVEDRPAAGPEAGEVTLAVSTCGICGTDLHFFSGRWPLPSVTPGHEISGIIIAIGDGVENWQVGDRVCVEPSLGCGACRFCLRGEVNRCLEFKFVSIHRDGGMASEVNVPVDCLHRLPDALPDSLGALIEPLAVAVHIARVGEIRPGDTVAVCGAGTIGLLSIVAAREAGAVQIIASARHPQQQDAAGKIGARAVAPEDFDAAIADATLGLGVDAALETVGGAGQAVGQAIGAVRPGGAVVLGGGFTRPASIHLWRVVSREIRLLGANCYSRRDSPTDFERALEIAESGRYPLHELITHNLPLSDAAQAFGVAADKASGAIKVQIDCQATAG